MAVTLSRERPISRPTASALCLGVAGRLLSASLVSQPSDVRHMGQVVALSELLSLYISHNFMMQGELLVWATIKWRFDLGINR